MANSNDKDKARRGSMNDDDGASIYEDARTFLDKRKRIDFKNDKKYGGFENKGNYEKLSSDFLGFQTKSRTRQEVDGFTTVEVSKDWRPWKKDTIFAGKNAEGDDVVLGRRSKNMFSDKHVAYDAPGDKHITREMDRHVVPGIPRSKPGLSISYSKSAEGKATPTGLTIGSLSISRSKSEDGTSHFKIALGKNFRYEKNVDSKGTTSRKLGITKHYSTDSRNDNEGNLISSAKELFGRARVFYKDTTGEVEYSVKGKADTPVNHDDLVKGIDKREHVKVRRLQRVNSEQELVIDYKRGALGLNSRDYRRGGNDENDRLTVRRLGFTSRIDQPGKDFGKSPPEKPLKIPGAFPNEVSPENKVIANEKMFKKMKEFKAARGLDDRAGERARGNSPISI